MLSLFLRFAFFFQRLSKEKTNKQTTNNEQFDIPLCALPCEELIQRRFSFWPSCVLCCLCCCLCVSVLCVCCLFCLCFWPFPLRFAFALLLADTFSLEYTYILCTICMCGVLYAYVLIITLWPFLLLQSII